MTQDATDEEYHPPKTRRASMASSGTSSASLHSKDSTSPTGHRDTLLGAGSAPHSRSCSFRNRQKPSSKELEVQPAMVRRNSMPLVKPNLLEVPDQGAGDQSPGKGTKLTRVRSFKTTSKGVINRGDSFKKKSTHSLMSTGAVGDGNRNRTHSGGRGQDPQVGNAGGYYKVITLGGTGVGKSTLCRQFMTSEFTGFEGQEGGNTMTVAVQLDGVESTLEFFDPVERTISSEQLQVDAYIVVFSITDHASFGVANSIVRYLRVDFGTDRAIILVANKIDLVRKRKVSADEARLCAESFDCKYAETSAALNHHVDELLVGSLSQIRLKLNISTVMPPVVRDNKRKDKKKHHGFARSILNKLFRKSAKKTQSCDNLYAL
ncbi:GTP-binding protein RAD-like [Haliotis rufescens]|uniref:GTP-binding protein RAD-like n=1 Tax=Haliotis rufescens TaxID=6454 RepID=UPI00201E7CF8|nr:GTP-binding protein RAD-like [Haliotis rufescens]